MSWDVTLVDDRGHIEGDWNYTHNVNPMIEAALTEDLRRELAGPTWAPIFGNQWWKLLDGMKGVEGAQLLKGIIANLEAEPERFRAMNPDNDWGDYDGLLEVLREMRDRVLEWPCRWEASG